MPNAHYPEPHNIGLSTLLKKLLFCLIRILLSHKTPNTSFHLIHLYIILYITDSSKPLFFFFMNDSKYIELSIYPCTSLLIDTIVNTSILFVIKLIRVLFFIVFGARLNVINFID